MKKTIKALIWIGVIASIIYHNSWKEVLVAIGAIIGVFTIIAIVDLRRSRKKKRRRASADVSLETTRTGADVLSTVSLEEKKFLPDSERKERIMYVINDTSLAMEIVVNTPRQYGMTCKLLSKQRTVETPLHNFTKEGSPLDMFIEVRIEKYTREDGDTTTTNVTFCFDENVFYSQNYNTILLTEKNTPNNGDVLFEANLRRIMDDETPSAASDNHDDVLAGERDE